MFNVLCRRQSSSADQSPLSLNRLPRTARAVDFQVVQVIYCRFILLRKANQVSCRSSEGFASQQHVCSSYEPILPRIHGLDAPNGPLTSRSVRVRYHHDVVDREIVLWSQLLGSIDEFWEVSSFPSHPELVLEALNKAPFSNVLKLGDCVYFLRNGCERTPDEEMPRG